MFKVIIRNTESNETIVDNLFEDIKLVKKTGSHPLYPEREKPVDNADDTGEYFLHLLKLVKDPPKKKDPCPVVASANEDSDDDKHGYFGGGFGGGY